MLLNIPHNLPAVELLKKEHIFLDSDKEPSVKPLKIALVNLMPVKITTETDFIRLLSGSALPVELDPVKMKSHRSKNTSQEHLDAFYKNFEDIQSDCYDGLIVTGAPVELLDFEEVTYLKELNNLFDWAYQNVRSTLYICWGAQAALHHFYGIRKYTLSQKLFGIFEHTSNHPEVPLLRGFDDRFQVPHSRHTEVRKEDIIKHPELTVLAESEKAGVHIVMARNGKDIFITGHSEYTRDTLHNEYLRDIQKGLPIEVPYNYYIDNNPEKGISVTWKAHAHLMFRNWLTFYVNPNSSETSCAERRFPSSS
ncbi:MAG: homoserine O-succinyltransferase [Dysgonamonadaceae bacterium]|jgi:homoserine O-succinyltransferase|nr:homoserine O-succinyltransferase [Dysgonamonadaceae bacterium]